MGAGGVCVLRGEFEGIHVCVSEAPARIKVQGVRASASALRAVAVVVCGVVVLSLRCFSNSSIICTFGKGFRRLHVSTYFLQLSCLL